VAAVNAGGSSTYTIRVTNNGPSSVTGAVLTDPAVTNLTLTSPACTAAAGNQCTTAPTVAALQGAGVSLPALASGAFYEFTVTGTVAGGASGSIANAASVTPPAGTTNPGTSCVSGGGITRSFNAGTGACTSTDTNTVTPVADLTISKTDGVAAVNAGGSSTYTIRVTNNGPSSVTG
ncbi:MAG: DUF11 domain-containing protein, partial [Rhodobacteraceae bacterium]|nr:DUF11 domain-containing protein [Paracoccaceae bacterium]